jgi:hypothetical protein
MVTGIHNTRASNKRSAKGWHHDYECFPDFAFGIQDMQFRSEVQRQVEEAGKASYRRTSVSAAAQRGKAEHTTSMA